MPIELKGLNYYSKVFKRTNYRLSNSTFWVVIRDSGSNWASTLLERVFIADPESVLSPPNFELPWVENGNKSPPKFSNGYSKTP